MNNAVTLVIICERAWPEDQFPCVEGVFSNDDKARDYMRTAHSDAEIVSDTQWQNELYYFWLEHFVIDAP